MADLGIETQDEIDQIMSEIEELQNEMSAVAANAMKSVATPVSPVPSAPPVSSSTSGARAPVAAVSSSAVKAAPAALKPPPPPPPPTPSTSSDEFDVSKSLEEALSELDPSLSASLEEAQISAEAAKTIVAVDPSVESELMDALSEVQETESFLQDPKIAETQAPAEEDKLLKEFSGVGDEPWLEETMANLKAEGQKDSLLDEIPMGESDAVLSSVDAVPAEEEAPVDHEDEFIKELAETEEELNALKKVTPIKKGELLKKIDEELDPPSFITEGSSESLNSLSGGSLSMSVKGEMTLRLNYESDGQQISVHFSTEAIEIQFSDGTEFKIPVRKKALKKAA